jgi:hypothetical protein
MKLPLPSKKRDGAPYIPPRMHSLDYNIYWPQKNQFRKYLSLRTLVRREKKFVVSFHPYLSNMARLKPSRYQKFTPP